MRLCTMCYKHMMRDCHWAAVSRDALCEAYRQGIRRSLVDYSSICEQNPAAFDYLKNTVFTFPI
jgi:hypothetical protein